LLKLSQNSRIDEIIGQETVIDDTKPVPVPVALNFVISALVLDTVVTVHQTLTVVHLYSLKLVLLYILIDFHDINITKNIVLVNGKNC